MVMLMIMTPMMRPEDGKGTKESGANASVWLHDMTEITLMGSSPNSRYCCRATTTMEETKRIQTMMLLICCEGWRGNHQGPGLEDPRRTPNEIVQSVPCAPDRA